MISKPAGNGIAGALAGRLAMFKKLSIAAAAIAMATTGVVGAAPATAQYRGAYQGGYYGDRYGRDGYRGDYRRYDDRGYRDRYYRHDYRRCSDGTTGTIVGAIAGGLFGNAVAGRGDRTAGTLIGGAAGALAGRAIDKSGDRCYR